MISLPCTLEHQTESVKDGSFWGSRDAVQPVVLWILCGTFPFLPHSPLTLHKKASTQLFFFVAVKMMETTQKWRDRKFIFSQYCRQCLWVSLCPSAVPLVEEFSFFCCMGKGEARKKIKPWCCWDEKAECRSVTAGETEPFFSLKWNRVGKKSIVAGGNVSNAVRSFWAKKEESAADNSYCFPSCVSSPTDVSCHAYLVNPPFRLLSLCAARAGFS